MADKVNVISITGSLRKGSFNAALARQLPKWQPAGMTITPAPDWRDLPVYNADDQNSTGFPATATKLADAIRAADGVLFVTPEYNYGIPGGLKNAIEAYIQFEPGLITDDGEVTNSATEAFLRGFMMEMAGFIARVYTVLPRTA